VQPARSASRRRSWAAVHTSTRCAAAIRSRHLVCIGGIQVGKLAGGSSAISPVLSVHAAPLAVSRANRSVGSSTVALAATSSYARLCRSVGLEFPIV